LCSVFRHRLFFQPAFAEQDLRPEIGRHTSLVERVRELPPVSFSYGGQPVDSRRAPADFIQFWLRKGAHVLLYGALGMVLAAALGWRYRCGDLETPI
jgi:hypothetical protein